MQQKQKKKKNGKNLLKRLNLVNFQNSSAHRIVFADDSPPHKLSSISAKLQFPLSEAPTLPFGKKEIRCLDLWPGGGGEVNMGRVAHRADRKNRRDEKLRGRVFLL